jgi:hypothetical protein
MNTWTARRTRIAAAGIGLGGVIAAALYGAGPAHADDYQDTQFITQIQQHHIVSEKGFAGLKSAALSVCTDLNNAPTSWAALAAESDRIQAYNPQLTTDNAEWFVSISVVIYCPWNTPPDANSSTPAPAHGTQRA